MKNLFAFLTAIIFLIVLFTACEHTPPDAITTAGTGTGGTGTGGTGTGTATPVCFEADVLPIFISNCAKSNCHDAGGHQDGYVLDSYANILHDGIVPYRATNSKIYKVLFETGNDKMPPAGNLDLTAAQKAIIGKWINEGAKNTVNCGTGCDTTQFRFAANISPILTTNCLGCHAGAVPSAGINLSNYFGVKQQVTNGRLYGAITHTAGYSPMPKNGTKLSDCQITQIKKWIDAGALNN
ncbi:MAG TPA: hypothetical protein VK498_03400 [Ferruginibacter sp.]|nr:hypothetical protein [Ferruginibacter sp.]